MIKIYVTLNGGHGQYNYHMMHYHVWVSYHAKLDDDDFDESHTNRQTLALSILNFFQSRKWLKTIKKKTSFEVSFVHKVRVKVCNAEGGGGYIIAIKILTPVNHQEGGSMTEEGRIQVECGGCPLWLDGVDR